MNSHLETTSCAPAVASTRVVSVAGPPSATAEMQKRIENAAMNMGATTPAQTGPTRRTHISVDTPTTSSDAKTIHTT